MLLAYQILLAVGIIAGGYTVGLYLGTQKAPFKNPIGQMLLSFSSVALAFYVFNFIRAVWPSMDKHIIEEVRFGLFLVCTLVIIHRAYAITHLKIIIKRERELNSIQIDRRQ